MGYLSNQHTYPFRNVCACPTYYHIRCIGMSWMCQKVLFALDYTQQAIYCHHGCKQKRIPYVLPRRATMRSRKGTNLSCQNNMSQDETSLLKNPECMGLTHYLYFIESYAMEEA